MGNWKARPISTIISTWNFVAQYWKNIFGANLSKVAAGPIIVTLPSPESERLGRQVSYAWNIMSQLASGTKFIHSYDLVH